MDLYVYCTPIHDIVYIPVYDTIVHLYMYTHIVGLSQRLLTRISRVALDRSASVVDSIHQAMVCKGAKHAALLLTSFLQAAASPQEPAVDCL